MPRELADHPEVLYGAAVALLIVILLTPAVGGMARLLGVVDVPDRRRLNLNPIPRLGGIAIFFGIFVPALAFLDLSGPWRGVLLGAAIATVVLFWPLLVLAVPIIDTSFVVARRLKHGERIFAADQAHLHHRFLRRGFTQRRAAVTMWAWCATLAAAALATRFIPFRAGGEWHLWETAAATAIGLVALGFSVYVVYLLEIVKLANPRVRKVEEAPRHRRAV